MNICSDQKQEIARVKNISTNNLDSDCLLSVGPLFSSLDGDKETNISENNSNVLNHSISHISHDSDHDSNEALNDSLFWAATFNRVIGNREDEEDPVAQIGSKIDS